MVNCNEIMAMSDATANCGKIVVNSGKIVVSSGKIVVTYW